jgi:hypothetical protein
VPGVLIAVSVEAVKPAAVKAPARARSEAAVAAAGTVSHGVDLGQGQADAANSRDGERSCR